MNDDNGSPFRPFAKQDEITLRQKIMAATIFALMGIGIALIGAAITVAVTYVLLVSIGGFALSFWNVVGIGLLWYMADVGLRQGMRRDQS